MFVKRDRFFRCFVCISRTNFQRAVDGQTSKNSRKSNECKACRVQMGEPVPEYTRNKERKKGRREERKKEKRKKERNE